jgi:outer membrane protein assembly factor BamB
VGPRAQSTLFYFGQDTSSGKGGPGGGPVGNLVALDGGSGSQLWSDPMDGFAANLVATDSAVYAGFATKSATGGAQGSLQAFRAADGKALWHTSLGAVVMPQAATRDAVYAIALNLNSGGRRREAWRHSTPRTASRSGT